jgi:hypothetical protein
MRVTAIGLMVTVLWSAGCAAPHADCAHGSSCPPPSQAQADYEAGVLAETSGISLQDRRRALSYYEAAAGRRTFDIFAPDTNGRPTVRRVVTAPDETRWAARAAAVRLRIEANGQLGSMRAACLEARETIAAPFNNVEIAKLRRTWSSACPRSNGEER